MQDALNPLTVIEAVGDYNDWQCSWLSESEVVLMVPGTSLVYEIHFIWQKETNYLHLICFSDLEISDHSNLDFLRLLMLANQKLWIGSFGVLENNIVAYRHMLHLKEWGYNDFESLIDDVIGIAIDESESFFPSFEKVLQNEPLSSAELDLLSSGVEGSA